MEENRKVILDLLQNKAALKQNIADDCEKVFKEFKKVIKNEIESLQKDITDQRIRLSFREKGNYEIHVFVGSDALVFHLHNNVFRLPDDNPLWGTKYLKEDDNKGFFGVIYVYNFLAESFIQNRTNDPGYLIGRMFINKDRHVMMEGQGQLGFLFRDLENTILTDDMIGSIVQSTFAFALGFDLLIPPFDFVAELSVGEIQLISNNLQLQTGKRLGFKMKSDDTEII